jgi:hypothetical protein
MADIVINATPSKAFSVDLVGVEYLVKPPKMAVLAVVASAAGKKGKGGDTIKHIEDLVKIMFKKSADEVLARLADPEDELDYQQVMDTAEQVIEAATGNPTSSPQDSSKQ